MKRLAICIVGFGLLKDAVVPKAHLKDLITAGFKAVQESKLC